MAEILSYTCGTCGEEHQGLPDWGYDAPTYYHDIPEAEREARCRLSDDLCSVDGEYYFVRGVLQVPVVGTGIPFGWGIWSSLGKASFERYVKLFEAPNVTGEGPYFGWFSNRLPFYPDTLNLKLEVRLQNGGLRPLFGLEPSDHPLAIDQRDGMSWQRAVSFAEQLMHGNLDTR